MSWWRSFGTADFPVRQSHLNDIASQNGCAKRFFYEHDEATTAAPRERAHWRPSLGTAVHRVLERALTRTWSQLVDIYGPASSMRPADAPPTWAPRALHQRIDEVLREELTAAAEGKQIDWYGEDPESELAAGVSMALFGLRTAVERAEEIVACEAPFRAELDAFHLEGTLDLVYRPRGAKEGTIALADWKTGERKLHQVLLDHGYQGAIYAHALEHGVLWPGTEREQRLGAWPTEIHIVHLRDGVPYVKKPRTPGKKVGDLRGPGWCPSQRAASDVARLRVSLREVVGMVRMGRRLERLGEQCARCPFRGPCLGAGHELARDEQREIAAAVRGMEIDDGLDEVA